MLLLLFAILLVFFDAVVASRDDAVAIFGFVTVALFLVSNGIAPVLSL